MESIPILTMTLLDKETLITSDSSSYENHFLRGSLRKTTKIVVYSLLSRYSESIGMDCSHDLDLDQKL